MRQHTDYHRYKNGTKRTYHHRKIRKASFSVSYDQGYRSQNHCSHLIRLISIRIFHLLRVLYNQMEYTSIIIEYFFNKIKSIIDLEDFICRRTGKVLKTNNSFYVEEIFDYNRSIFHLAVKST